MFNGVTVMWKMFQKLLLVAIITSSIVEPRSPRVYNVLISSKKNLAPSQAVPVYEPVFRTTSLGYSFGPFVYTHLGPIPDAENYAYNSPRQYQDIPPTMHYLDASASSQYHEESSNPSEFHNVSPSQRQIQDIPSNQDIPLSPRQYPNIPLSQSNPVQANTISTTVTNTKSFPSNVVPLEQYVPCYSPLISPQCIISAEIPEMQPQQQVVAYKGAREQNNNSQKIVANFKSNPGIPDVPPPPLPVKTT